MVETRLSTLILALGLVAAPAASWAANTVAPQNQPANWAEPQPLNTAPGALMPGVYPNPNATPPWAANRDGAGHVTDPVYGVPVPGYGENDGG